MNTTLRISSIERYPKKFTEKNILIGGLPLEWISKHVRDAIFKVSRIREPGDLPSASDDRASRHPQSSSHLD